MYTCLSGNTERPFLSTKIRSRCSLLLRRNARNHDGQFEDYTTSAGEMKEVKGFTNGNIPWQYLPERSGSVANGSPSPFRHSQRNPPNWFTHLAVAGSQSFISSSYQAWSLKQPCFFTNDSVFIPRIASNFRFSVLNQCNVDAESRSLVFFFSSVSEAWGEVGGHWRASYQLKKRVRGPRPRRGSCWKGRKRLHPPIWSSHWLAPLTNQWLFLPRARKCSEN